MKKPNFFIIGAPKCGTTSLAAWLAQHPAVFVSEPKELDFFNTDIRQAYRDSIRRYESFFRGVNEAHIAIGEGSTGYLRSNAAVPAILEYSPDARFIVVLRNPIDMAISWHGQMLFAAWENERDFAAAWALQDERRAARQVPSLCPDPAHLLYGEVCKLGEQLERLFSLVPRERVFVMTLDQLREDPRKAYLETLKFLGVPDDGRIEFPVLNEAKRVPTWLAATTRLVHDFKRKLGVRGGLNIVNRLNRRLAQKPPTGISTALRLALAEYFSKDIEKLERLLNRDFSNWLGTTVSEGHRGAETRSETRAPFEA